MTRQSDIIIMSHLKHVSLLYGNYPHFNKSIELIQKEIMTLLGYPKITQHDLLQMTMPLNEPKKAYYVNAFLTLGFSPTQIGQWFDLSPAGVSWHKTNPPKKEYVNLYLKMYREYEHTRFPERYNRYESDSD